MPCKPWMRQMPGLSLRLDGTWRLHISCNGIHSWVCKCRGRRRWLAAWDRENSLESWRSSGRTAPARLTALQCGPPRCASWPCHIHATQLGKSSSAGTRMCSKVFQCLRKLLGGLTTGRGKPAMQRRVSRIMNSVARTHIAGGLLHSGACLEPRPSL